MPNDADFPMPKDKYADDFPMPKKEETFAQKAAPYVRMGLEGAGMGIGGAIGAASGLATAGATSYPGMLLGGSVGGAGGSLLAEEYEKMVGIPTPQRGITEQATHVGKELGRAAGGMMAGEALGGVARPLVSWLAGKAPITTIAKMLGHEAPAWMKPDQELIGQIARDYNFDITAVEKLDSPTLQKLWHSIMNAPGPAAERIRQWIKTKRIPQTEEAMEQFSSRLGPEMSADRAGALMKQGAGEIEAGLTAQRRAATGPMYREAFQGAAPVEVGPVLEKADQMLTKYPTGTSGNTALNRARNLLVDEEGNPLTNLEQLQKSRREIADIIAQKGQHKDLTLQKEDKMLLTKIKAGLDKQMYQASPAYQAADREFAEQSKPLNALIYGDTRYLPRAKRTKTIIGKILDTDNNKLETAVDTVFKSTAPQIKAARQWFMQSGKEDTWNQIVRAKIDQTLNNLQQNVTNMEGGKLAYNIQQKLFGKGKAQEQFRAALGAEDFRHLDNLMKLFQRSERLVYSNSATASQQEVRETLDNMVLGPSDVGVNLMDKLAWVANAVFHPHGTMQAIKVYRRPEKNARLVEMLFDPELRTGVEQVMSLPPGKRIEAFSRLMGRVGGMEAARAFSNE